MPVPINYINDVGIREQGHYFMDYSVLLPDGQEAAPTTEAKKKVTASNKDANLLYNLWTKAQKAGTKSFDAGSIMSSRDFMRLKTMGYVVGSQQEATISEKGRNVICVMALSEPNNFEKSRERKPYTQILAETSKQGKSGYRIASSPKYSSDSSNNLRLG